MNAIWRGDSYKSETQHLRDRLGVYAGTAVHMLAAADYVAQNWASAGIANAITPETDPFWFTPAQIARHRLRAVVRADREACGDGKWVKVRGRGVGVPWTAYASKNPIVKELIRHWEREDKSRYRWEWRR